MKKIIMYSLILAALMIFIISTPDAKAEIANGKWGNLIWTISDEGVLDISGTGAMIPFSTYSSKEAWRAYDDEITSVVIGDGVASIGDYAFCRTEIKSIQIPDSVLAINSWAFYGCEKLSSANIPSRLQIIESGAFWYCESLKAVTIPGTVKEIKFDAFCECTGLVSAVIQNGVTKIGSDAFKKCVNLKSLTLPNTLTEIGYNAFAQCSALTSVDLPDGLKRIGSGTFSACVVMNKITVPSTVSYIGDGAFSGQTVVVCPKNSYVDIWARNAGYSVENDGVLPTGIQLDANEIEIQQSTEEDAQAQLTVTFDPSDTTEKKLEWSSSDITVATVDDNGLVTAHNTGTCVITVKSKSNEKLEDGCTVTVLDPPEPGITIDKSKLTFKNTKSQTVKAILSDPGDSIETVKSSKTKVATVEFSGQEIKISPAKKAGKATITVTTARGAEAKIEVTVKESWQLNEKKITLKKGETFKIAVSAIPSSIKAKSFESSKSKVAKVDKKGKVTAKKKGKATITVTLSNGETLKLKVTVK